MAVASPAWNTLVSVATLGTSRTKVPADVGPPDPSLETQDDSPERRLLRLAAAHHLWTLAGTRATVAAHPPAGVAAEEPPRAPERPVSEAAAWRLARILAGEHTAVLPEWFAHASRVGAVLPRHWVPTILDALDPAARVAYASVLGEHAAWLAARNPAWTREGPMDGQAEERWAHGTLAERIAALRERRRTDPDHARALVESTWDTETAESREAFLETLLINIGPADEPFLERVLDDRRKTVRAAAVQALAMLPQSAHARRNLARLETVITAGAADAEAGLSLRVEPPGSLEPDAVRDGIEPRAPGRRKVGERAYRVAQMVALVHPAFWIDRFRVTPREFVRALAATDYGPELIAALSAAAARHADGTWMTVVAEYWAGRVRDDDADEAVATLVSLARIVAASERSRLLERLLPLIPAYRFDIVFALFETITTTWDAATTTLAFHAMQAAATTPGLSHAGDVRAALRRWGRYADVEVASAMMTSVGDAAASDPSLRTALEQMSEVLDFRSAMHKELTA